MHYFLFAHYVQFVAARRVNFALYIVFFSNSLAQNRNFVYGWIQRRRPGEPHDFIIYIERVESACARCICVAIKLFTGQLLIWCVATRHWEFVHTMYCIAGLRRRRRRNIFSINKIPRIEAPATRTPHTVDSSNRVEKTKRKMKTKISRAPVFSFCSPINLLPFFSMTHSLNLFFSFSSLSHLFTVNFVFICFGYCA